MDILPFLDSDSNTISYLIYGDDKKAALIDSVLDYSSASGRTSTVQADKILKAVKENDLDVEWILETHAHADHISAAQYLKQKTGAKIAIGEHIKQVQKAFADIFNNKEIITSKYDANQFDHLFTDGETFKIGSTKVTFLSTPGHTPACGTYIIQGIAFVGDTIFMPDSGTARCDFPDGDAETLYKSITEKIFTLPDNTKLFMCHDYGKNGRDIAWQTTVAEEKANNIHMGNNTSMQDFVKMRNTRDAVLDVPKLLLPAVQINMQAGQMPKAEDNGIKYIKIPLNKI